MNDLLSALPQKCAAVPCREIEASPSFRDPQREGEGGRKKNARMSTTSSTRVFPSSEWLKMLTASSRLNTGSNTSLILFLSKTRLSRQSSTRDGRLRCSNDMIHSFHTKMFGNGTLSSAGGAMMREFFCAKRTRSSSCLCLTDHTVSLVPRLFTKIHAAAAN